MIRKAGWRSESSSVPTDHRNARTPPRPPGRTLRPRRWPAREMVPIVGLRLGKKIFRNTSGSRAVDVEVVELDGGADEAGEGHLLHRGLRCCGHRKGMHPCVGSADDRYRLHRWRLSAGPAGRAGRDRGVGCQAISIWSSGFRARVLRWVGGPTSSMPAHRRRLRRLGNRRAGRHFRRGRAVGGERRRRQFCRARAGGAHRRTVQGRPGRPLRWSTSLGDGDFRHFFRMAEIRLRPGQ